MGRASSSHQIYAAVNNCQAEHQSMVVESLGTLNHINVKILFDSCATSVFLRSVFLLDIFCFFFEELGSGVLVNHCRGHRVAGGFGYEG
jgi:hypothetical protein